MHTNCRLKKDCILLWTADIGSLVKLGGLTGFKIYDPHTSVDRKRRQRENGIINLAHVLSCRPTTKLSHVAAAFDIRLNREDVEWAEYK